MRNLIIIVFILSTSFLMSQNDDIIDTRGKEFWLAFPPNIHNNALDTNDILRLGDSLMIFITAETQAKGKITYYDVFNNEYQQDFELFDSDSIYNFKISYYDFEIPGFNTRRSHEINNIDTVLNYNETITNMSFKIEADNDIRVYANSQAVTTSEAMMIFPKKSLGKKHMVMSYYSDYSYYRNIEGKLIMRNIAPSQFTITATENNTNVIIKPKVHTNDNGLDEQNITLNAGQTYLVQADVRNYENIDLTGTEIISDKPIVVIGSHHRAKVPQDEIFGVSRDILLEQIPPLKATGTNAFIVPFPEMKTASAISNDYDFFRILAYYDNTKVNFNKQFDININKGEFFEGEIDNVYNINSNKPIMVAKFKKSSTYSNGFTTYYENGDPFMMIIPTAELYLDNYTFTSVQAYEYQRLDSTYKKVYEVQYVTVIIEKDFLETLILDGETVDESIFNDIPNSNYVYGHIEDIGDGTHTISAESNFGIYVYGIGEANSYGYVGGLNLNPIDHTPPKISSLLECYTSKGEVSEKEEFDSKVSEVRLENERNISLNVEPLENNEKVVSYEAELTDKYQDGFGTIVAVDSMGLENEIDIAIPGFTVGVLSERPDFENIEINDSIPIIRTKCYEVRLYNYGNYTQNITSIELENNNRSLSLEPSSATLEPQESITIRICVDPKGVENIVDQLIIKNDCIERLAAIIDIFPIDDPTPPGYEFTANDCYDEFNYTIFDNRVGDFGIKEINLIEEENCFINLPIDLNPSVSGLDIQIIDPYLDAYYIISVLDSADKETIISDTIPGFTIEFAGIGEEEDVIEIANTQLGLLNCKDIVLFNYGNFPISIDKAFFASNFDFTVPTEQLPILIEPQQETNISVCFSGEKALEDFYRDTLIVDHKCLTIEVPVRSKIDSLRRNSSSRCDVELLLTSGKINKEYVISNIYPNPAVNKAEVNISSEKARALNISMYNTIGEEVFTINETLVSEGIFKINIDISDIPSGSYFVIFDSENQRITKPLVINK